MINQNENLKKVIIPWNMTYGCNLNCPECFQPYDKRIHPSVKIPLKVIENLEAEFHDRCLLKITGGEVFAMPGFLDQVVPYLVDNSSFDITVTTNFTFPLDDYKRFIEMVKGRLQRFSLSWHHIALSPDQLVEKVKAFRVYMDQLGMKDTLMKVNFVLIPENFEKIKQMKDQLDGKDNIKLHFQHYRIGKFGRGFYKYSEQELKEVKDIVDDFTPLGFNDVRSYKGKRCAAGSYYLVINPEGDVFTCHEAYELGDGQSLGNLADGSFKVMKHLIKCPYEYCTSPIPSFYKIVKGNK